MEVDILDLDKEKAAKQLDTAQSNNDQVDYVQEFNVENILDTDGLSFKLITEESHENTELIFEDSSDSWEDLSAKLIDEERDTSWHPQDYELKKVAVFENKDLHEALFSDEERSSTKKKDVAPKKPQKYKKGPKPLTLENIDDEEKKKNIIRCREYVAPKNPQKYKKGPKPLTLENIDDEEKKKNIIRCREYRCKKNEIILEEMT